MTIQIKQVHEYPEPVKLTVDGCCVHNRYEDEVVEDYDGATAMGRFCTDCNAELEYDYDQGDFSYGSDK